MSRAAWCDLGQHAFPEGQRGSTTVKVTEQVVNQWGGTQPCDIVKDVCAACAKDYGYRNLKQDALTEKAADEEAEDIRERSGGLFRRKSLTSGKKTTGVDVLTEEAEAENDKLRLSQLEREVNELKYGHNS